MSNIPSSPSTCAACNQTVNCDIFFYANATNLQWDQKLAPDDEITGRSISRAFIVTAVLSIVMAILLLIDEARLLKRSSDPLQVPKSEEKKIKKLKHGAESLLHTFSDQQIVTGITLIIATEKKACQISAYHYNLVCVMMLMSMITHLNTLINITEFFRKGYFVGSLRFISISATIVYTGILFQSRNTLWFPRDAGSLSILPAACFENKNGSQGLGFHQYISDVTSNKTMAADRLAGGFSQYMILSSFCVFALVMLGIYSLEPCLGLQPGRGRRWVSWGLRALSTIMSSMIVIYAVVKYHQLRSNMEVEKWYQVGQTDAWTFSQLLPYVLLGSSGIAVMKALDETIDGPRGSRHDEGQEEVKADDNNPPATWYLCWHKMADPR